MNEKIKSSEKEIEKRLEDINYPPTDDIYYRNKKEVDVNPEDISNKKTIENSIGKKNEESFENVKTGVDLDIPGSELDDVQENIGSEDEENNYYSESDTN